MRLPIRPTIAAAFLAACAASEKRETPPGVEPHPGSVAVAVTPDAPVPESQRADPSPVPPDAKIAPAPAPPPWKDAKEIASNAGTYRVLWRATPEPIPQSQNFALDLWVFPAAASEPPLTDLTVSVDAGMPEHGHGMNQVPVVTPLAGRFHVEGMRFHMPGRWEMYFDITRGALTERAQVEVMLE
jgi:YtkA-like protein